MPFGGLNLNQNEILILNQFFGALVLYRIFCFLRFPSYLRG
jgi:hypothetical protein